MAYATVPYTGDGSTVSYQVPFPYLNEADIQVYVDGTAVAFTTPNGSTVQLNTAPANGSAVVVKRSTPKDVLSVDFGSIKTVAPASLDVSHKQLIYIMQEAFDATVGSFSVNNLNQLDAAQRVLTNLADPTNPTDAVTLQYLTDNFLTEMQTLQSQAATSETNAATSATNASSSETAAGNSATAAANSETNASASETAAANSATAAANSETNTAASETSAANSATAASTSETNAANSATAAANSETNAAASETNAANSATAAANSKTAAANSETAAANSETNAAGSASSAAAQLVNFKNVFYGPLGAAPTTRPDGSAIQAGDLYYDTVAGSLKVYSGGSWGVVTGVSSFNGRTGVVSLTSGDVTGAINYTPQKRNPGANGVDGIALVLVNSGASGTSSSGPAFAGSGLTFVRFNSSSVYSTSQRTPAGSWRLGSSFTANSTISGQIFAAQRYA